jgi:hypothetical protein
MNASFSRGVLAIVLLTGACTAGYGPDNLRKSVRERPGGRFIVYFSDRMVDKYDSNPLIAVRKYLEHNELVPPACSKGVVVEHRSNMERSYDGAATFRCAE